MQICESHLSKSARWVARRKQRASQGVRYPSHKDDLTNFNAPRVIVLLKLVFPLATIRSSVGVSEIGHWLPGCVVSLRRTEERPGLRMQ